MAEEKETNGSEQIQTETNSHAFTVDQLERMADVLLEQTGFSSENVDVVKLANALDFKVFKANFIDDVAGQVIKNENEKAIYINANDKPGRQRFTIAHEIAHILLHHQKDSVFTDYRNKGAYSQQEFEADNFAAALLMPKERSHQIWNICNDVDDFASIMGVSRAAASIRLMNLGLI